MRLTCHAPPTWYFLSSCANSTAHAELSLTPARSVYSKETRLPVVSKYATQSYIRADKGYAFADGTKDSRNRWLGAWSDTANVI